MARKPPRKCGKVRRGWNGRYRHQRLTIHLLRRRRFRDDDTGSGAPAQCQAGLKGVMQLAEHDPEKRKRVIITALIAGAIATAFFVSSFFILITK